MRPEPSWAHIVTDLSITSEPSDGALASVLLDRYYDELAARFPQGPAAFDLARIAARAEEFGPPHGVFLVARRERPGRPTSA